MNAPEKVQVLYLFPTREEEQTEREELDTYGRFYRIRSVWVRRRHRQELYQAAARMVEHMQQEQKADAFLALLKERRMGVVPCALHPVTMVRNQFFPGEEDELKGRDRTRDKVNADTVEEILGYRGWVVGSRIQRSRFWDFVEMLLRGHTPTDMLTQLNCEEQYTMQRSLLEAWERKWGRALDDLTMNKETEESDLELGSIYCGHAQGVECYNPLNQQELRRYAALYWKAGHSLQSVCSVVVRKATKTSLLGFPREAGPNEHLRPGTHTLEDWIDFGAESIADFPFPVRPRFRSTYREKLPEGPLNVGREPGSVDEFVDHQLYGLAQGVLAKWPESQTPLLQLIEERLCNKRQRYYDERRFRDPAAEPCVPQVEQVELELLGRVFTQGSPARREIFWVYMCAVTMGMKEFQRSRSIPWEYSMSKANGFTVIKSASQWIAEGANPFHKSKLIAYGRGGVSAPVPADDPQVLANAREYTDLRMLADYGMVGFVL